jgi:5-methylcytosine-specific restriction protein A
MVLAGQPLCVQCETEGRVTLATDVDHVVAKSKGGDDSLDNLQALCHECHSKKTVTMDGGYGGD